MPPGQNDADALAAALAADDDTCAVLQRLRGPWAAVHWRAATRTLTFGRDVLGAGQRSWHNHAANATWNHRIACGRDVKLPETPWPSLLTGKRSLLVHEPDARDGRFILASVSHPHGSSNLQEPFWQVRRCPEQPGDHALVSRFAGCSEETTVLLKLSPVRRSCLQDSSASRLIWPHRQVPRLRNRRQCKAGCGAMPGPARSCCASVHAGARQSNFLMQMWQRQRR